MNFQSKILNNTQIFEGEISGEYLIDFIHNEIDVEYQVNNRVIFSNKKLKDDLIFSQLEEQFISFLAFFNLEKYENYKDSICEILYNDAFKNWSKRRKILERNRLLKEIYLNRIILSSTTYDSIINGEIDEIETNEMVIFFNDDKNTDIHNITVQIDFKNFEINYAFFE